MSLSGAQIGKIGEMELVKQIVTGSDGRLAAIMPAGGDDQRDIEVRLKQGFEPGIAIQAKVSTTLHSEREPLLVIRWELLPTSIVDDPRFFYCFAHLDVKLRSLVDPVFLVPSAAAHAGARPTQYERRIDFTFHASMKPHSRDRWSAYRLPFEDLGGRLLEVIRELNGPSSKAALAA